MPSPSRTAAPTPFGGSAGAAARRTLLVLVCVTALAAASLSACSSSDATARSDGRDPETTTSTPRPVDDPGRMVALGEEELLADLLALDLVPVASTAATPERGFIGMGSQDLAEVAVLDPGALELDDVEAREPDTVVAPESVVHQLGLDGADLAFRLVTVDDDLSADERLMFLAAEFDRTERASSQVQRFDETRAETLALVPDGCRLSVVTVTPGGGLLLWVAPLSPIPATIEDLGCELVAEPPPPTSSRTTTTTTDPADPPPDPRALLMARADPMGRIELNLDEASDDPAPDEGYQPTLELISAPVLLLLQPDSGVAELGDEDVQEDHLDALAAVTGDLDGWDDLPAVDEDRVRVLDPAAFPGLAGRVALIETLAELITDADLFEG